MPLFGSRKVLSAKWNGHQYYLNERINKITYGCPLSHAMYLLYYNPPEKIQDKPSLTRSQAGGGLKGNDQKKYTIEVKTVKARKSEGLV